MIPIVVPIIKPEIDWSTLNSLMLQAKVKSTNIRDFLLLFPKLSNTNINTKSSLADSVAGLTHLNYGFLILCFKDTLYPLMSVIGHLNLFTFPTVSDGVVGVILSGSLESWKSVMISNEFHNDTSIIFREILKHFELLGLAQIWSQYKKSNPKDPVFLLEHKK